MLTSLLKSSLLNNTGYIWAPFITAHKCQTCTVVASFLAATACSVFMVNYPMHGQKLP